MADPIQSSSKFVKMTMAVSIVLAIVAAGASAASQKALTAFSLNTVLIIIFALVTIARIATTKEDVKAFGEVSIQGLWVTTSLGLVYLTLATAPYFELPMAYAAVVMVMGAITTILSGATLYTVSKKTGVMLSV